MHDKQIQPTDYPDVNAILNDLLSRVKVILGEQFLGMYLDGSLASGHFDYDSSDIDFLIVTHDELSDERIIALQKMHKELGALDTKWAIQLEGSYIPKTALRRYDSNNATHPHIDRGNSNLLVEKHDVDWLIQRYVLCQCGIVIEGISLQELIAPISQNQLQQAVLELIDFWCVPMIEDTTHLVHDGSRSYVIMTLCRILYTLEYGTVVSKTEATDWAQNNLDEEWSTLIKLAANNRNGTSRHSIEEAQAFIRYAVERSRYFEIGKK
jgi:aminoglycoside adenylyltransferase-like protein/nucleotidyltransferase-like protein